MATYLITQATGKQSQWVIRHLLQNEGVKVHAVVRNPDKIPSTLEHPSIKVFKGDSTDFDSISKAAQGCKAAFLNTFPIPGIETQQAKTIVDACLKAGVESIVASTTLNTSDRVMWDNQATKDCNLHVYFSSKAEVEDIVRNAGFKAYTILRPAFIHFDYYGQNGIYNFARLPQRILDHAYEDGAKMPQTDASDIGKYGAAALLNPDKFAGQEIGLSNQVLSIKQVRDILSKVTGSKYSTERVGDKEAEEARAGISPLRFHLWANVSSFDGVEEKAKKTQEKFCIPFTSLEEALQRDRDLLEYST